MQEDAILERIESLEKDVSNLATTGKVALGVGGLFLGVILSIATWYLNSREEELQQMAAALQSMAVTMAEISVTMGFYSDSFGSHVADPDNHPNNTERVNIVISNLSQLRDDIAEIGKRVSDLERNR